MKNWKAIAGICLVFVFGMITGGVMTAGFVRRQVDTIVQEGPDAVSQLIVRRLGWQLRLDAEQRAKLEAIVKGAREQVKEARERVEPQIQQTLSVAQDQVRTILRPEQAQRFDQIIARSRQRFRRFDGNRRGPNQPPIVSPSPN